jgi:integrase
VTNLTPYDALSNERVLAPPSDRNENIQSRVRLFAAWLTENNLHWSRPDLAAYRDHLLKSHKPSSVRNYLATIRAHYKRILADNDLRRLMLDHAPGDSFADRHAFVQELTEQLRNAVDPVNSPVRITTKQDRADSENIRLTAAQAMHLIHAPGTYTIKGLRDTVAIALMLTTGVRKFELCAIEVDHLRQRLDGQLALLVPEGKGNKQRLVPYGAFEWVLPLVDHWLLRAGIGSGPVIRGFHKGGNIRKNALTPRSVRYMLAPYPIVIDGTLRELEPHDLRRTYARLLYDAGMRPEVIQQNLGHASVETTMGYIGDIDADKRRPPSGILHFDVSSLLR